MATLDRTVSTNALDTTYIIRRNVKTLEKKLVLSHYVSPAELPRGAGSTARWTLDANLTTATATDAIMGAAGATDIDWSTKSPNEDAFTTTKIERQTASYGVFVPYRTKDLRYMPQNALDRLSDRINYKALLTKDTLCRAEVDGSGTGFDPAMSAVSSTSRKSIGDGTNDTTLSATDYLTAEDIALVAGDLEANDAEPFSNGMYACVVHSAAGTHLKTDVSTARITWEQVHKYVSGLTGQEALLNGTIGAINGMMVTVSNNITTSTVDTRSAYNNIFLAQDGIGNLTLEDSNPDVIINKPGPQSTDNPFRMVGSVSFVLDDASKRLDVNRAGVLYSTV